MTKQLSVCATPAGVGITTAVTGAAEVPANASGTTGGSAVETTTAAATTATSGISAVLLTNGSARTGSAIFLQNANLTPTIISPSVPLPPAVAINESTMTIKATAATTKEKPLMKTIDQSTGAIKKTIVCSVPTTATATKTLANTKGAINGSGSNGSCYNNVATIRTTAAVANKLLAATAATTNTTLTSSNSNNNYESNATSATTITAATKSPLKTTASEAAIAAAKSKNDANGRSAALERAYVHDVYENCEEPTGSLRPRVAQFLSNLDAGSVVCDVGCGSGRYLTQCNPSICTIGVDRCHRLSRVASEKGGEVSQ